jgi:hypothetical protein
MSGTRAQADASFKRFTDKRDAADKLSEVISRERRQKLEAEQTKTARLRAQRLAREQE